MTNRGKFNEFLRERFDRLLSMSDYGTPEELIKAWNKRAELTKDI